MSTSSEIPEHPRGIKIAFVAGLLNTILCCALAGAYSSNGGPGSTAIKVLFALQLLTQAAVAAYSFVSTMNLPKKSRTRAGVVTVVVIALGCVMLAVVLLNLILHGGIC